MTNKKTKYILSSVGTAAIGFASIVGSIGLLSGITPSALAENLPNCTNIKQYSRWGSDATTISGPVDITEDIVASYEIPDQTERCKAVFNLNGHTVSEAYYDRYNVRSSLKVGKNAVVIVNGDGGKFAIGSPEDPCYDDGICVQGVENLGGAATSGITVSQTGELTLNDIAVESYGYTLWNAGKTELNNVTADMELRNDSGELTVNSGSYSSISTEDGGKTTINGGNFSRINAETNSDVIINDGTLKTGGVIKSYVDMPRGNVALPGDETGSKTNDITINGGNYENAKIYSAATITGGNFKNTTFEYDTHSGMIEMGPDGMILNLEDSAISGGSFDGGKIDLNTNISGGTFKGTNLANNDIAVSGGSFDTIPAASTLSEDKKVIQNDDGTYSVVDESAPGEEPIQACEVRIYTDENNYTTFTGVINLTEDTVASYEVDDQSDTCRFIINLNGKKLTSVDNKEAISVGSNVSAKINGENGKIEQSNTESTEESKAPAAVVIKEEGAASIKDVTIETKNDDAPAVSNSGKTTLTNVTAGENSNIKNTDNGNLTIKSGNYDEIHSTGSGSTTIEGGTVESVTVDDNSNITVNNGTVNKVTVNNDSEATINDGDFKDSNISSGDTGNNNITINGGDFTGATVSGNSEISGGDFTDATVSGSDTTISGGNFTNTEINSNNTTISDGDFSGATISGNSEISGGNFDNANVSGESEITGGTFRSTDISDNSTVTGGNFDVAPTVPEGSEVVTNDDGTVSVVAATSNPGESGTTGEETPAGETTPSGTTSEEAAASEEDKLEVPDTGAMLVKELGSREMAIGVVIAAETAILSVCGYIIYRIRKAYRVRFNH